MLVTTADAFIEVLKQSQLLTATQLAELVRASEARGLGAHGMAQHALDRNWLTAYQANQLLHCRGASLHLGPYILLERLGEGGMAQVFKARHRLIDRVVALKVIRPEQMKNVEAVGRFRREVRAVAQLSHPNIVLALDADEVDAKHFLIMEYVEGLDLSRLVKRDGPLPVLQACDYIRQAVCGLAHAHERGLVHRDIKPSNLMVSGRGSQRAVVKVLDMGLARSHWLQESVENTALTHAGTLIGTPEFLAPEQAANPHGADIRADLYSLGCTFYYLLTGRPPFPDGTAVQKLFHHRLDEPPPVEVLRPEVPLKVAAVVRKLMAKRPEDRYQQPKELAAVLAALVDEDSGLEPVPSNGVVPAGPILSSLAAETANTLIDPTQLPVAKVVPPRTAWLPHLGKLRRLPWFRQAILGGVLLLVCLVVFLVLLVRQLSPPEAPKVEETVSAEERARTTFAKLTERTDDPGTNFKELRQDLLDFRLQYAGTPQAKRATELLNQLPGPLDDLDPKFVPAENQYTHPGDLVALLGDPRLRHWAPVGAVAFSPDGHSVASGGDDGLVYVWDHGTGKRRAMLAGHGHPIASLVFSGDGKTLISGSHDGTARLWDVPGRKERSSLRHESGVRALALGADGKLLVTATHGQPGARGGAIRLWEVANGKEAGKLEGHQGPVWSVAIAGNGPLLASGGEDKTVRLWDAGQRKEVAVLSGHQWTVAAVAFSADGKTLASGSHDKTVKLWDVVTRKEKGQARDFGHGIAALAFLAKTSVLVVALHDGTSRLWDTANGQDRGTLGGHWGPVQAIAVSADGHRLVSGGKDQTVKLWDLDRQQQRQFNEGGLGWLAAAALTPDTQTLATGHLGGKVRLWDAAKLKEVAVLDRHEGGVSALTFAADGKTLLSGGWEGTTTVWETATGRSRATLRGHRGAITSVGLSGTIAVTASQDHSAKLWDQPSGRERTTLQGHGQGVAVAVFSPDGKTVATGSHDHTLRLWDVSTGKEKGTLGEFTGEALAWTPDGKVLISGSQHGSVRLRDVSGSKPGEGKLLPGLNVGWLKAAAVAPDGKTVVLGSNDGRLIVRSLAQGKEVRTWQLPGQVSALAFASDGRHLLCVNGNGTVSILRLAPPERGRQTARN